METTPAILETFRSSVEKLMNYNLAQMYGSRQPWSDYVVTLEAGKKFIRVVRQEKRRDTGEIHGRSVYCFIQIDNGDILKAAGWKAPAKHARGSVFNANILEGCGPYGVAYLYGGAYPR